MNDAIYELLGQQFEWDPDKARQNWVKHRVLFTEAATAFFDEHLVVFQDEEHSEDEQRYIVIGRSQRDRRLFVVHVYRGDRIRLISAREPTSRERTEYEGELGRRL